MGGMYALKSTLGFGPPVATACSALREQFVIVAAEQPAPPAPNVQLPTVAMPLPLVTAESVVPLPPPPVTLKVTVTPDTTFPNESVAFTLGAVLTCAPDAAVCASPALMASPFTVPAVNVTD